MSDIFFTSLDEAPLPPDEVRIRQLAAQPRPDGGRVNVKFSLTPFQKRPNLEIDILNSAHQPVSNLSVVEAIDTEMEFTMHLREAQPGGQYRLQMQVFYADVEGNALQEGETSSSGEILQRARYVVDRRQIEFEVPTGARD
ncbi:MAG: hypothetical protein KIS80_07365 [Anaerolineales bacterium]|nr:hypothetical protein [Anaerolineales bacterium]